MMETRETLNVENVSSFPSSSTDTFSAPSGPHGATHDA